MEKRRGKLKLGKGSGFVKRRLSWLPQEDLVREADFCSLPEILGGHDLWLGLVVSHHDGGTLARQLAAGLEPKAAIGAGDDGDRAALIGNVACGPTHVLLPGFMSM